MTTDQPDPPSTSAEQSAALLALGEQLAPLIEFAEGQKRVLIDRGWAPGPAEQFALVILAGMTREALRKLFGG